VFGSSGVLPPPKTSIRVGPLDGFEVGVDVAMVTTEVGFSVTCVAFVGDSVGDKEGGPVGVDVGVLVGERVVSVVMELLGTLEGNDDTSIKFSLKVGTKVAGTVGKEEGWSDKFLLGDELDWMVG